MGDEREGVHSLAIDENIQLDEVMAGISRNAVIERGVALGAALELVVEIDDQFAEWHLELDARALLVQVDHLAICAAPPGDQLHDRADVARGTMTEIRARARESLDLAWRRHVRGVVDLADRPAVHFDFVFHAGSGDQELHAVLSFKPLLDDFHVQEPEKTAAEPEAKRLGGFRLGQSSVIQRRRSSASRNSG